LRWKKDDPEFANLVTIARHEAIARKEQRLDEAGERASWRADLAVLERSPETRADWSDRAGHGSGAGHTWLHSACHHPWFAERRRHATEVLRAIGIEATRMME